MKKSFSCEQPFRTPRQLALRWQWNIESVRRKVRRGELKCVIVGGRILVPLAEIERVEAEGTVQPRTLIKQIAGKPKLRPSLTAISNERSSLAVPDTAATDSNSAKEKTTNL